MTWGPFEIVGPDLAEGVRRLKSKPGPNLVVLGSSTLLTPLLEEGLVDELVVSVFPVLLGTGKRLFAKGIAQAFEFIATHTTSTRSCPQQVQAHWQAEDQLNMSGILGA